MDWFSNLGDTSALFDFVNEPSNLHLFVHPADFLSLVSFIWFLKPSLNLFLDHNIKLSTVCYRFFRIVLSTLSIRMPLDFFWLLFKLFVAFHSSTAIPLYSDKLATAGGCTSPGFHSTPLGKLQVQESTFTPPNLEYYSSHTWLELLSTFVIWEYHQRWFTFPTIQDIQEWILNHEWIDIFNCP